MPDKELMHWIMTVAVPLALSVFTFYNLNKTRTEVLERRLTKIEVLNEMQNKILDTHDLRLTKNEEEQKITRELVVQMRSLTEDIGELRSEIKEMRKTNYKKSQ